MRRVLMTHKSILFVYNMSFSHFKYKSCVFSPCTCQALGPVLVLHCRSVALVPSNSFATPRTAALQAPLSRDSPGKNTGVDGRFLLRGSS